MNEVVVEGSGRISAYRKLGPSFADYSLSASVYQSLPIHRVAV